MADLSLDGASDRTIWDYALAQDAVIITKDEDFALRRALEMEGPAVVWIRLGNTRKGELLRWFEGLLPEILVTFERGEVLVEVA